MLHPNDSHDLISFQGSKFYCSTVQKPQSASTKPLSRTYKTVEIPEVIFSKLR